MTAKRIRKPKTIIYKRADFSVPGTVLETAIKNAFIKAPKPALRREKIGDGEKDSGIRKVIGASKYQDSMLCGAFLLYEIGKDVTFVVEDDDADEFIIESQNPAAGLSEEDNKNREVLESALYFGVWGNHVVLVQSAALKARDLENHLKWLLRELTSVLPAGVGLSLSDEPTQAAREQIQNLPVKSVEIGTPLESEPVDMPISGVASTTSHRIGGKAWEAISAFLGEGVLSNLNLDDALDESNLEVTLQLKYKRKTTESGHAALDKIARAMRHAEPEDTKVVTGSGTVIKGSDLKLTGSITVDTYNAVVDTADLYTQMYTWLEQRIAEGSVG